MLRAGCQNAGVITTAAQFSVDIVAVVTFDSEITNLWSAGRDTIRLIE